MCRFQKDRQTNLSRKEINGTEDSGKGNTTNAWTGRRNVTELSILRILTSVTADGLVLMLETPSLDKPADSIPEAVVFTHHFPVKCLTLTISVAPSLFSFRQSRTCLYREQQVGHGPQ